MGKYYVTCGTLEVIVQADNPQQAVCTALDQANKNDELDDGIVVDERGFRYLDPVKVARNEAPPMSDVVKWLFENDNIEKSEDDSILVSFIVPQHYFSLENFMEVMGDDDDDDFEDE
jgi:hypothetical protein